jgi:hypothetical protein
LVYKSVPGLHIHALASSPAPMWCRGRSTNSTGVRLSSPRADRWWWRGRGGLRRAATARSRRRARGHSKSGEARGDGGQCAAVGATQGSREEFGRVGRRRELAEGCAHRVRGNGGSADGGCALEETGTATYIRVCTGRGTASRLRPPTV